jgi:hypothetical protein
MWTAFFENYVTDHVALVVHIYLLGGATLSTIMVGAGILWENGPLEVHKIAHRLVFWGIFAETLCSIALFVFDEGISSAQQSKIIALKCESLELEKIIAPRVLAPSRLNRRTPQRRSERIFLASIGKDYSGTEVRIQSAHDTDAERIAADLKYLLKQAGWEPRDTDENESHMSPTEIREGITVHAFFMRRDNPANEPARVLLKAFVDVGLDAHLFNIPPGNYGVTGANFGPPMSNNIGFVYVAVGARPMEQQLAELKAHPRLTCD